jgi:hypothetical protein
VRDAASRQAAGEVAAGATDVVIASLAAGLTIALASPGSHFAFVAEKNALAMKKVTENPIYECQRFAVAAGPGPHVHTVMPSSRVRVASGTVHTADRFSCHPRCRWQRPA